MNKKIFSFMLTIPSLFSIATIGLTACGVSSFLINGGSININGLNSGVDKNAWKSWIGSNDVSDTTFWTIEPLVTGIFVKYDTTQKGAIVTWNNLNPGEYIFKVKAVINYQGKSSTSYSNDIFLNVNGSIKLSGGANDINGYTDGEDKKHPWQFIYMGNNYSKFATWSIQASDIVIEKVKINYDEECDGAIVSWNNLMPGQYPFSINCFYRNESGKNVYASSETITLYVVNDKKLYLSGGTQFNEAKCHQFGKDLIPIKTILTSTGEDVSLNCIYDIIDCQYSDLFYIGIDGSSTHIYWKDTITTPQIVNFKIVVRYEDLISVFPYTFWVNFKN